MAEPPPIEVHVADPETEDQATVLVQPGDYALICAEPCHLEHTQMDFDTGTVTITLKGYRRRQTGDGNG